MNSLDDYFYYYTTCPSATALTWLLSPGGFALVARRTSIETHDMALKIPPVLVMLLAGLLMLLLSKLFPGWHVAWPGAVISGFLVALVGVAVCIAGVASFRAANTTVNPMNPDSASALVIVGIYRYSRNPMYLGFALGLLGLALYLSNTVALLGVPAFVLYMNQFQIVPEEQALERCFGQAFRDYLGQVRRWV